MRQRCALLLIAVATVLPSCTAPFKPYRTTVGSGHDEVPVLVVGGTPYEMGHAVGRSMKDDVRQCLSGWLALARKEAPPMFTDAALDAAWKAVSPYTSEEFKQELRGVADGSGVSYDLLRRAHMVPVVSSFSCSGVAVWGPATRNGHVLHFRNLDFTVDAGLQDHPLIVVYLPDRGVPHVNVTIAGYVGSHTGMNAEGVVLGEKGESPDKEAPYDVNGIHFSTLFRDVLYHARGLSEAVKQIKSAKLIKRYYFYVSGAKGPDRGAVKIKVTTPDPVPLHVWTDDDKTDELYPKVLKNAIYNTMDNKAAYAHLKANWGKYDPEKMIELSRRVASKNGSLCNVVYDGTDLELWVAFAEKDQPASKRPYVHLRLRDYLDPSKRPPGAVPLPER